MQLFPVGRIYDFWAQRRLFFVVSFGLTFLSLFLLAAGGRYRLPAPQYGTDFKGGTEIEVAFLKDTSTAEIRKAAKESGFPAAEVIPVDDPKTRNRFLLRVEQVSTIDQAKRTEIERALCYERHTADCPPERVSAEVKPSPGGDKIAIRFHAAPDLNWVRDRLASVRGIELRAGANNPSLQSARDNRVEVQLKSKGDQLLDALRLRLGADRVPAQALRVEWIGPKAGAQLRDAAVQSLAIALIFIMIYIAFRFDLRFAPGAVFSLAHDAIGTVGILILLGRELNLITVAAVLTIVGYSVNDTVVVYDRVRENIPRLRGSSFVHIINASISEMLGRTILTSSTVVMSMLAFFIWGTGTLKDFSLSLIIGVILGTYSSIYVALPLTEWLDRRFFSKMQIQKPKAPIRKKAEAVV